VGVPPPRRRTVVKDVVSRGVESCVRVQVIVLDECFGTAEVGGVV
jgi:hypothetical protein